MSMKITCCTEDGRIAVVQGSKSMTFADVKAVVSVDFKTNPAAIKLSFNGDRNIPDSATFEKAGLQNDDMLLVIIQSNPKRRPNQRPNAGRRREQNVNSNQPNRKAIQENLAFAMAESPEIFVPVYMLYIDIEVNGIPVKAFVDSGAQTTIMSKACAKKTKMMGLVDPRFAGVAMGVGAAKILGKVHLAPVKIGENSFYDMSFSVLDQVQNVDILIGLDFLKKYQCSIDLKKDVLLIGTTEQEIAFLPESQLPPHAKLSHQRKGF